MAQKAQVYIFLTFSNFNVTHTALSRSIRNYWMKYERTNDPCISVRVVYKSSGIVTRGLTVMRTAATPAGRISTVQNIGDNTRHLS